MKKILISALCFLVTAILIGCGMKGNKESSFSEEENDAQHSADAVQSETDVLSPDEAETISESPIQSDDEAAADDIVMTIKDGEYNSKTASFVLKNTSDKEYTYGSDYALEEKIESEWREIVLDPPLTWNLLAYRLEAHSAKEFIIDWSFGYGELPAGIYRLRKSVCDEDGNRYQVYAGFMISSDSDLPIAPPDSDTYDAPWEISPGDPLAPEGFSKP